MSVRKHTARSKTSGTHSTGGSSNVLRGVAFWLFLLTASFVVGALVISPLINLAMGRHDNAVGLPVAASNSTPPNTPPSTPMHEITVEPSREKRQSKRSPAEEDISITPDPTDQNQPIDRKPQPMEDSHSKTAPTTPTQSVHSTNNGTQESEGVDTQSDSSAKPDQTPSSPADSHRLHHRTRPSDKETDRTVPHANPPHDRPAVKSGDTVQKSETIDGH